MGLKDIAVVIDHTWEPSIDDLQEQIRDLQARVAYLMELESMTSKETIKHIAIIRDLQEKVNRLIDK